MFAPRQRFIQGGQRSAIGGFVSANTNVTMSSTQSKYGGTSLALTLNNGTNAMYSGTGTLPARGTGNFTLEAWMYPVSKLQNFPQAYGNNYNWTSGFNANMWGLYCGHNTASTKWTFWVGSYSTSGALITSTTAISYNAWTHIAITRSGNNWTMWLNGVSDGTGSTTATLDGGTARQISFGMNGTNNAASTYNGYIDEFRYSNIARYSASFTPNPDGPFIDDPNTLLLMHYDNSNGSRAWIDDNS